MIAVPARLAGVERLVLASPAGADNELSPALLAAASWIGIEEWYVMGGAQAVAALAHGTETIEPVEKIVGPGNAWVTAAKLAVFGVCSIDLPAGPSEVLVIANGSADPALVAADLLCQAEHGEDSTAVLVTTSARLVDRVEAELERLLPRLNRREILAASLQRQGLAVIASDQTDLISFANEFAAEHVTILTEDPEEDAKAITAAGSVFVGVNAPESAGDYATGANHVLPTGGLAGACGPLSVEDFGSWRQVQRLSRVGLAGIRSTITTLADAEGLDAHRLAADIRFETASS
jgi:histidinol dehydrogenase